MESTSNNQAKFISNSQGNTTVMHSKLRTIFGTTRNSLYVIKEHKYEVKRLPLSLETPFVDSVKMEKNNFQTKTSLQTEEKSFDSSKEDWQGNKINNSTKVVEETDRGEVNTYSLNKSFKKPINPVEQKNYDCEETVGDCKAPVQQKVDECKNTTFGQYKELKCQSYPEDLKEVSNTVSEIRTINTELNAVFKHRISDIETKTPNDLMLQIRTYQEWIETLLKRNKATIKAMNALREDLSDCIEISAIDADTRLRFYRDRDVLVKFIQEAFRSGIWHLDYLRLETVSLAEFLKRDLDIPSDDNGSTKTHSSPNKTQLRCKKSHFTRTSLNE